MKCEHGRKFKCRGRLHTDLNNIFTKTVGDYENHTADPRSVPIREYYDRLRKESQQNQINPHNILLLLLIKNIFIYLMQVYASQCFYDQLS